MLKEIKDKSLEFAENGADTVISIFASRFQNPFVASFCLSWILWNWHAIIFLIFSSQAIECKFPYIENYFYTWKEYTWGYLPYFVKCFLLPLLSALFYVLILPYLDNLFTDLNKKASFQKRKNFETEDLMNITHEENKKQKIFEIQNKEAESAKINLLEEQIISQNIEINNLRTQGEKMRRSFVEENASLQSGYEEQVKQLRDTISDQSRSIIHITQESEFFRKESNEKFQLISDLNMQIENLKFSFTNNGEFAVKVIERILSESKFFNDQTIQQLNNDISLYTADEDFKIKIRELIGSIAKPDDIYSYDVSLEHESRSNQDVSNTLDEIYNLLGGRISQINELNTRFIFESNNKLNIPLLTQKILSYTYITSVIIIPYDRLPNDAHIGMLGY